jgi:hypothetical protein
MEGIPSLLFVSCLASSFTQKWRRRPSDASGYIRNTQLYNPEDGTLLFTIPYELSNLKGKSKTIPVTGREGP